MSSQSPPNPGMVDGGREWEVSDITTDHCGEQFLTMTHDSSLTHVLTPWAMPGQQA